LMHYSSLYQEYWLEICFGTGRGECSNFFTRTIASPYS
jgi:hypothetical protein